MYKLKLSKILLMVFTFCSVMSMNGQKTKLKVADKEYDKYSYIDAQQVYLQVVKDGYVSAEVYRKLGNTYYFNSEYTDATKWYQRLVSDYPEESSANDYYRLAQCLKSTGKYEEANEIMEQYAAIGGDTQIAKIFKDNPDALEKITFGAFGYELIKVSVNTENSDFGPGYFGDKVIFASVSDTILDGKLKVHEWNNQPFLDLYTADVTASGDLENVSKLNGDVNTKYHESSVAITKEGRTMYFTRNNYFQGKKGRDKDKSILLKIYKATLNGDNNWTNIQELPFNSDDYSVAHPALSNDGKRLYFSSDMEGTKGLSDIWYVAINDDGTYGDPVNLEKINTEARESFPFISQENNLYFASDGHFGLGGYDIYVSPLSDTGDPTTINNLGEPANSAKDDFGFIFDESKKMGYLSSNRDGDAGFVNDDIYLVKECQVQINGAVTDLNTGELLPGAEVVFMDSNNSPIGAPIIVGTDAAYSFDADCSSQYKIRALKDGYIPNEIIIDTPDLSGAIEAPIALEPEDPCGNDLGCILDLQPIYFDLDRYNIRADAAVELAKVLAAMRQYPELVIHIESHTDSRANDRYNEILSERRAQSTLDWLVERGIALERLTAKGYGEYQLVNECSNDVDCTEEKHQLNRRSMFIIQPLNKEE